MRAFGLPFCPSSLNSRPTQGIMHIQLSRGQYSSPSTGTPTGCTSRGIRRAPSTIWLWPHCRASPMPHHDSFSHAYICSPPGPYTPMELDYQGSTLAAGVGRHHIGRRLLGALDTYVGLTSNPLSVLLATVTADLRSVRDLVGV